MNDTEPHPAEPAANSAAAGRPIGSPRDFLLACIGLVSLLADEIPALLERSVQRGSTIVEQAQTEVRPRNVSPDTGPQVNEVGQTELSRRMLATHRDFETLLQQVIDLEQQIDRLAAQRSATQ
jgi:hypothetical protein